MKETEAIKLLMRTKAVWSKQPDDQFVQAEWVEALGPVEYYDASRALTAFRDLGGEWPPTIGQLRVAALDAAARREAAERARRRALEQAIPPDPEHVAAVRVLLDDFYQRFGKGRSKQ